MLISELIAKLEEFKAKNGDIEIIIYDEYCEYFLFNCCIGIDKDANKIAVFY